MSTEEIRRRQKELMGLIEEAERKVADERAIQDEMRAEAQADYEREAEAEAERKKTPRLLNGQSYHVRDHNAQTRDGVRCNIWQVVGDRDGRVYAESVYCEVATFIESKLTAEFVRLTLGVPKP